MTKILRTIQGLGLLLVVSGCASSTHQTSVRNYDSQYAGEAAGVLQKLTGLVKLRETTLEQCMPELSIHTPDGLTWPQAVAYADRVFGDNKLNRALFLRKYYRHGQSADALKQMRLHRSGLVSSTGGSRTVGYDLPWTMSRKKTHVSPPARASIGVSTTHGNNSSRAIIPDSSGAFFLDSSGATILGAPMLTVHNVRFADVLFGSMTFDVNDKLVGFTHKHKVGPTAVFLHAGGNTSGHDESNYYYVSVLNKDGMTIESRDYDEDLLITRRSVMEPGTSKTEYADTFRNGVRHERLFYEYKNGSGHIVRTVRFPVPREARADDEAIAQAFAMLRNDNPRVIRRARHTLALGGDSVVAAIKTRFDQEESKTQLNFIQVLDDIGTPKAVDLLISLLDSPKEGVQGKACQALANIADPAIGPVLDKYRSEETSLSTRRWCLLVFGHAKATQTMPTVVSALDEKETCHVAAMVLRWFGTPQAVKHLERAGKSTIPYKKDAALRELKSLARIREVSRR